MFLNKDDLLDSLVNDNADEWNTKIAKHLNIELNKYLHTYTVRNQDSLLSTKIKLDISAVNAAEFIKEIDEEDPFAIPAIDKFTVKVDDGEAFYEGICLNGKVIVGIDFTDVDLNSSFFNHCVFYDCIFTKSNLTNAKFNGCVINNCKFDRSTLDYARFIRTRFFDVDMTKADINYVSFIDCILVGLDTSLSNVIGSLFTSTSFVEYKSTESKHNESEYISCSINISDMSGSKFKSTQFVECILISVNLNDSDLNSFAISCTTSIDVTYDDKYTELFKMNHILNSPAIVEWVPEEDEDMFSTPSFEDLLNNNDDDDDIDDFTEGSEYSW